MRPYGQGKRKILVAGEAPGKNEDMEGRPFIGPAGQRLREILLKVGVDLDRDCWTTNSLICYPGNRNPTSDEISFCRPNVINTIEELKPEVMILTGSVPVQSVLGWLWKPDPGSIGMWAGWKIPHRKLNCWICPTYHPSHLLRSENPVLDLLFEKHIKTAISLNGRPWPNDKVPYEERIQVLYDAEEAAYTIRSVLLQPDRKNPRPVAFDYETNCLKPDSTEARIVSCSVSDGITTIAYPWHGEVVAATIELLRSPVPKIIANARFELRWTKAKLGFWPRNVIWDTVIAAHILDNRPGTAGTKFQAFVRLGQPDYGSEMEQFFKSDGGGNSLNRIRDCDLGKLLRYNALDSFLEWYIAKQQMEEILR